MPNYGFIAYPDGHPIVGEAVEGAVELGRSGSILFKSWKAMEIVGFKVDNLVRESVRSADVVAADITYPNPNVFYEMGYAAAIDKPIIPMVNGAIEKAAQRIVQLGLFDTIGWARYTNALSLYEALQKPIHSAWTNTHVRRKNHSQPLFILDTTIKTDFRNQIFQ